jgi:predicted flap endonuclease-1-like 5' DNA nuclease
MSKISLTFPFPGSPTPEAVLAFWKQAWSMIPGFSATQMEKAKANSGIAIDDWVETWSQWQVFPWHFAGSDDIRRAMLPANMPSLWSVPMLGAWARAVEDFVETDIGFGQAMTPFAHQRDWLDGMLAAMRGLQAPAQVAATWMVPAKAVSAEASPDALDSRVEAAVASLPLEVLVSSPEPLLLAAPEGTPDDLTQIKGIGAKLAALLNNLGIFHFTQIAGWTDEQAAWIDGKIDFKGRVAREQWREQAGALG